MSNQSDFMGRIRDNWRRAGERETFRAELRLVPRWMIWLLVAAYVVALAALFHFDLAGGGLAGMTLSQVAEKELAKFGLVTAIAIPVSVFVMLIGYIGADARRRGMSPVLWELVALLVPYLIGAILYFVVREPLPLNCPQCRRAIRPGDRFCPYCGFTLQSDVPASERA
jgi:predicted anti-sigma-YlaC factor YlaD